MFLEFGFLLAASLGVLGAEKLENIKIIFQTMNFIIGFFMVFTIMTDVISNIPKTIFVYPIPVSVKIRYFFKIIISIFIRYITLKICLLITFPQYAGKF